MTAAAGPQDGAVPAGRPAPPRVALAVNPTSGSGRGARVGAAVARRLAAQGVDIVVLSGIDAVDAAVGSREAVAAGTDALVVVGGDGMVNLGVQAVAGTTTPLAIVPAGTGNDIARSLGLPVGDWARAADTIVGGLTSGQVRPVDAVLCRTAEGRRWFAGVLGAGFDAVVNERANGWSWPRGRLRYNLAIARELPVFRPRRYRLELDGETWTTEAMLVALGNGPSYGGGMRVCPDARMDDGLIDVVVLEPVSRAEFIRIFPRVYAGTHIAHPRVVTRRARRVRVECAGIVGYADGERFGSLPVTCEAVSGALRVLAPVPAGARTTVEE